MHKQTEQQMFALTPGRVSAMVFHDAKLKNCILDIWNIKRKTAGFFVFLA